ncbi:efflux RND transporter periplasmic adaptor subunit [Sneathiella chinensis]|uniref:MexE family multidrug efflux RND transporter periplasmic adaptor subunit n=1 Tax=Sneathiella chinensis TaxID=349750 RepID=A0ABQ5U6J3_9PROT|nr:efflux RND transporter periplasmic adaptor subunit [Sneathiella chinensis]GLQ06879.1 MexE family multidrug efflux RND transporter periplasmic adaptor subunit [Sneathiella chinensis]
MLTTTKSLSAVLSLLTLLPLLAACDEDQPAAPMQAPTPTVVAVPVTTKEVREEGSFVGRVEAVETFQVRARVQGFVEEKKFEDGAFIQKGDPLFLIEPAPFRNEIDRIKAEIEGAKAVQREAELALERGRELLKKGNVSRARFDETEATAAKAEADLMRLDANLRQAELQLSYTEISSPISGRIGRSAISVGNLVTPSSGVLAEVVSMDPVYATIAISERQLIDFRRSGVGQDNNDAIARLRLSDGSDYAHPGTVDFVDNKVDPSTDTITIRAVFPNPDFILFPNEFVTMSVARNETARALVVSQAAIQENLSGRFVLIVDENSRIKVRTVELGAEIGDGFVVNSGLEEGDMVVVEGLQKVQPDQEVKVLSATDNRE